MLLSLWKCNKLIKFNIKLKLSKIYKALMKVLNFRTKMVKQSEAQRLRMNSHKSKCHNNPVFPERRKAGNITITTKVWTRR